MSAEKDHYQTLGVPRDADLGDIKRAYRRAAKALHPDGGRGTGEGFSDASEAYEALRDSRRRQSYDRELRRGEGVTAPSSWTPSGPLDEFASGLGWGLSHLFDLFGGIVGSVRWWESGARLAADVAMDLELSTTEAQTGVRFPVTLSESDLRAGEYSPFWSPTPFNLTVDVNVPPGVLDSAVFRYRFLDGDRVSRVLQITVRIV